MECSVCENIAFQTLKIMELQTVFGSVIDNILYHDGIEEKVVNKKFNKDIRNDYILIKRHSKKIYIVDYFSRNSSSTDV